MNKLFNIVLLAAASILLAQSAHAQVIVIANPDFRMATIWKVEVRSIFTGESANLRDGSHVSPVLLKQGAVHEEFLSTYLSKTDVAFRAAWRSQVFSGDAMMPKSFDSEVAVVDYIAHTSGTIGYINKATPHGGVRVLEIK